MKNMEKIFSSPRWPKRPIKVRIDRKENFILFSFSDEGDREFYSIPADQWSNGDWIPHMEMKAWFTSEIRKYINSELGFYDNGSKLPQDTQVSLTGKQNEHDVFIFLNSN